MILNEAVTLLGYKVDERGLQKYQRQIENQRKEALKLLATHQKAEAAKVKAAENTARANERLDQRLQRNAERQLAQEIRNASRITAAKEREAAKQLRAQELAYNRQVAANARALAAMDRANERHLNTQIRQAQRASAAQARAAVAAAKATERERAKSSAFLRGGMGGMGLSMMGLGPGALSVGGAVAGAKSVYDTGVEREAMQIGLQNLPGMDKISAMGKFRELRNINASKAFGIEEAVKGFIRLKDMGLDASATALNAYAGIAASKPGKSMMDFVEAVADGVMGESERLKEFGINMRVDGDKAAITFRNQTVKVNRDAKSIEKALMDIGIKNYSKALSDAANSTAAKTRNMENSFKELKYQVWEGGLKSAFHNLIDGTTDLLKKWTPLAREFAIVARLNLPGVMRQLGNVLPFVAAGLGLVAANMVGTKMFLWAKWASEAAAAFRTLGAAQFFLNGGLGVVPTLIGGATLALGALIADFGYFMTTGDSMIVKFTERWPELNSWIKQAYESNRIFIYAVQIGFERIQNWIRTYILPAYQDWWNGMKSIWDWMGPKFTWLFEKLEKVSILAQGLKSIGGAIVDFSIGGEAGAGGNAANGGGGAPSTFGIDTLADNKKAADFARNARTVVSKAGYCLNAVWQIHEKTLGKGKAWSTTVTHAYLAAEKLAQDKRFKEIKGVTPEMLQSKDPAVMRMLHGATIIYDRGAGFSPATAVSGHAEVLDMVNKTVNFGTGPKSVNNRSQYHMNHGRVFVPVQQQQMPAPNQGGSFQTSSASVMLNQNFYGQTDPRKAGSAAQTGVQSGLNRVQIGLPTYTNGIA